MFTNGAVKDDHLLAQVTAEALEKSAIVVPGLLGSCSPYSDAFFKLAERTGGQVFIITPEEASIIGSLTWTSVDPNAVRIAQQSFELDGEEQVFEFFVDESLEEALISISGTTEDRCTIQLPPRLPKQFHRTNPIFDIQLAPVRTFQSGLLTRLGDAKNAIHEVSMPA